MTQRASLVVPAAPDDLYAWLHDVENWTRFLEGLEAVEQIGYRRYRWTITYAGRTTTCDVAVTMDARDRRFAWRHLAGAPFDGVLRLTPAGEGRTKVDLHVDIKPSGLLDGVVEFTGRGRWLAELDLQRLRELVHSGAMQAGGGNAG